MQKGQTGILLLAGVLLIAVLVGGAYYLGRQTSPKPSPPPVSSPSTSAANFNLTFKYGVGAENVLDTFQHTYTADMVVDPDVTIPLVLSNNELDLIYQKMMEIDFFSYPTIFNIPNPKGISVIPYPTYYFKVAYNGQTKELTWEDKTGYSDPVPSTSAVYKDEEAEKLKDLINLIYKILGSKEEMKKLPKPRGGYL